MLINIPINVLNKKNNYNIHIFFLFRIMRGNRLTNIKEIFFKDQVLLSNL